jgi:enolase
MSNVTIKEVFGYEVLDSRGNPTVAVKVTLSDDTVGVVYIPSGASTGAHEAVELRDGDASRYYGKGVLTAVNHVNTELRNVVLGFDAYDQKGLDELMIETDGTPNKAKFGANAILGVSLAVARAASVSKKEELYVYLNQLYSSYFEPNQEYNLPKLSFNVLNGGSHSDSGIDVQEFMILPEFGEVHLNVRAGSEIYHTLKKNLATAGEITSVGDEGGFAPRFASNEDALKALEKAIVEAGYKIGETCNIALDVAASEFYNPDKKVYEMQRPRKDVTYEELSDIYENWLEKYSIVSIEDPFAEDDFAAWSYFLREVEGKIRVVGDDLLVTNVDRIQKAIDDKMVNSALIKPNQIGSLYETMKAIHLAHSNGLSCMMSHRSGDTSDTFIADLTVATGVSYIKSGALARAERISKYNRLIEIEKDLESKK